MGKSHITKNNIVHAAIELAKVNGLDKVSVKDICEKAGISKNTFYQYFDNKDTVFGGTFATSDELKMAALPDILLKYDSPLEQFWEFSKIDIERQMSMGPKLLGTIAVQNVMHDIFVIEDEEQLPVSIQTALSMIKKMQRCKEIRNTSDAFVILRTIYSAAVGIDIRWTKTDGGFDFKREMYLQSMAVLQPEREITNY